MTELRPTAGSPADTTAAEAIVLTGEGAWLLDVREQDEWDRGHAAHAHLVPLSELGARLADIPKDEKILVVCRSGARSLRATTALREAGYRAVNVVGGMVAWAEAGGDLVADGTDAPRVD